MKITKNTIKFIKKIVADKKGENILILDVKKVCNFTSYFFLCNGTSTPHLVAIKNELLEKLKNKGLKIYSLEEAEGWILIDCGELIINIFSEEKRKYYNLERCWGDAKII